ncbi:MAG TPA: hypothetical protein VM223_15150 [Planctomycetota bacterium]|nr:hypothetical protein [Planctomycetota bacterium]
MPSTERISTYFDQPANPVQRHYEILRAYVRNRQPATEVADQFDCSVKTVETYGYLFGKALDAGEPPQFFAEHKPGPKGDRKKPLIREHVLRLRAHNYASTDIAMALRRSGYGASVSLVNQVLREEGLHPLRRRAAGERQRVAREIRNNKVPGLSEPLPAPLEQTEVADARALDLRPGRELACREAGIFLFLPLLVQTHLAAIVNDARMPGSRMIPNISDVLNLLALKLLDKERKSHVDAWDFDHAMGLFAGLNVPPKITATSDYSCKLDGGQHNALLAGWIRATYPTLCPNGAKAFALDFHVIRHRGENTGLENNYVPSRGKAEPSILTCYVRAVDSPMLCWGTADITHREQPQMPLVFLDYWQELTGLVPDWLYMDSRATNLCTLGKLNDRGVNFITIRRRGVRLLAEADGIPAARWQSMTIDTPHRRHRKLLWREEPVKQRGYSGTCRQIIVSGSRENPTFYLTNNLTVSAREIVSRYINRNSIENDLGINVNFFHLDCLASEVRLNVNLDVVLTIIANGCYRWLGQQLKGCQTMEPKTLYRKFVATAGRVHIGEDDIVVAFDRRSHNPIIRQAALDAQPVAVPWLGGKRLHFTFA